MAAKTEEERKAWGQKMAVARAAKKLAKLAEREELAVDLDEVTPAPPPKVTPAPNGVKAKSVQVRGALMEIKDGLGHVWTVPANEDEDYQAHTSIFKVANLKGYDERFEYEFHDDVSRMITDGWALVSRRELGLPDLPSATPGAKEYGAPDGGWHQIESLYCVKRPKILVERTRKAFKKYADTIAGQMTPAKDSVRDRQSDPNAIVTEEVKSATSFKEPTAI